MNFQDIINPNPNMVMLGNFQRRIKSLNMGPKKHTDPYPLNDLFSLLVRIYIYTV